MKRILIGRKVYKLYDSIDELPIVNFQKYNKYMLIDSGIGSDIDDVDRHITQVAKYIKAGDQQSAIQELQNMRQNMYMIASNISPKHLAFAALIHSINGEVVTDLSDENLGRIIDEIKTARRSWVIDLLLWLKKKIQDELEAYFPQEFVRAKDKEAYDKLKHRTELVLDSIINDKDNAEQIEHIDSAMLRLHKPKNFMGPTSEEIKYDKQFESTCLLISQRTNQDARKMTVMQFYSTIENIKAQIEAENKAYSKYK